MAARLKVFRTTNGLTESAVAVSSRAKALEAWGTKADLFKEGLASETDDPELAQAALANPGQVVTRSALAGAELARLTSAPKSPKKTAGKPAVKVVKPEPKRGPPPALVARVERLERQFAELKDKREAQKADFQRRRLELEQEEADAKAAFKKRRKTLEAELETARSALRAEGG